MSVLGGRGVPADDREHHGGGAGLGRQGEDPTDGHGHQLPQVENLF